MSLRLNRWLTPPPHRTAYFCSARQPGRVLRVSRTRADVPSSAVDPGGGGGGDPGEVRGEVERGALGGQQATGRSGDPHHHVARGDPGAVGEPVGDLDARRPSPPRRPARRSRDRPPRPARGPRTPREPRADPAMVAALVTSTLPPGRSSSRAPAMAARTATGSRPARTSSSRTPLMRRRRPTAAPGGTPPRCSRRRARCRSAPTTARRPGRGGPRASASRGSPPAAGPRRPGPGSR